MTYIKKIYDASTGEEAIIPMTDEEIAANKAETARQEKLFADREKAEMTKAAAKASAQGKLAALGLTADEVAALLG